MMPIKKLTRKGYIVHENQKFNELVKDEELESVCEIDYDFNYLFIVQIPILIRNKENDLFFMYNLN